jgi:NADPH-dependent 2,4-dienoyl-CoA reductase/sulfur reductase-like enzyme
MIAARRPDLVVLAIGGHPRRTDTGRDAGAWTAAESVLLREAAMADTTSGKGPVLVWGGGETGAETAEFAAEQGRDVVLVTTQPARRIARRAQYTYRRRLIPRLLANPRVRIAEESALRGVKRGVATLVGADGAVETLPVAQCVLARGRVPREDLSGAPALADLPVMVIGDARDVRRIGDAVEDAYLAVRAAAFDRASGRLTPGWRWPIADAGAPAPSSANTEPAGTSPSGDDPQPRWRD